MAYEHSNFSNANGVTFGTVSGLSGNVVTASYNSTQFQSAGAYLTTAMASNQGSDFLNVSGGFSGTNISGTIASNGLQLSVAPGGGGADGYNILAAGSQTANTTGSVLFNNGGGVTFGMSNNSVITATVATNYQSQGAYLTTAALSQDSSKYAGINGAITGGSITVNTSGVSINLPAYLTTAQPVGAYLTTARASNDAIGLNSALTANGVSMTANSSGLSLNFPAFLTTAGLSQNSSLYAGTGFTTTSVAGAVVAGTHDTNGLKLAVPAYLTTAQPVGAYLTTARASNDAIGLNTALTANGVSVTANSSGLSLNFPAFLTTAMGSANSSLFAATGFTTTSVAGAVIAGTHDTAGLKLAVPAYLTTAQPVGAYLTTARASNDGIGLNTAQSNVTWTVNSSGLSLDARGYAGTATGFTGTNVSATMTHNSAGFSLQLSAGAGGAGVAISASNSAFTSGTVSFNNSGALTIGTGAQAINFSVPATSSIVGVGAITISTSGSTISISGASVAASPVGISAGTVSSTYGTFSFSNANNVSFGLGTGASAGNITASASFAQSTQPVALSGSNGSFTYATASFGNSNNINFYTTNGSIVGSYADPDAWSILGNTAGASNTLALSNGTFYLAGGNNITLSQNGSTLTISGANAGGAATLGGYELFPPLGGNTAFSTGGLGTIYFQKFIAPVNVSFNNIERRMSGSTVSSAISAQAAHTYSYGMYSLGTGASSTIYNLIASSSIFFQASYSSNLSAGYTISQGAASNTVSSAGTVGQGNLTGFKHVYFPFSSTITAGGQYAVAFNMSSATTGATGPLRIGLQELSVINNLTIGKLYATTALGSNASNVGDYAQGVYSSSSNGLPATLALSGLTNAVSQQRMYLQFDA